MKTFLSALLMFCLFATLGNAYGLPDYLPDGSHPRIWLNNTIVADLVARKDSNTTEWLTLKMWCDNNLGQSLSSGYQGLGWYTYVLNYGLCYQMTGDQTYGTEGVIYLKALLNDKYAIGDGLGGASVISVDSGYVARSFGAGLAIGRDWLDGAVDLDAQTIAEVNTRLGEWITWYADNGYARINPSDNYYSGWFAMVYSTAIGLYGDVNYDAAWLVRAQDMWTNAVLPYIDGSADGGDWLEGWNYGPWASREYLQYMLAVETGTGDSSVWDETDWYEDIVKSHIHMLHPSRRLTSDDGSWSGEAYKKGWPAAEVTIDFIAETAPITSELKGIARWYTSSIEQTQATPRAFENMLWKDSTPTTTQPTSTNMDGLTYSFGNEHLISRGAEWSDTDATWIEIMAREAAGDYNQQGDKNVGELKISSRGVPLLVDADTWQTGSSFANVPLITGSHTYAPEQEWWTGLSTTHESVSGNYTYIKVDNLKTAYDRSSASVTSGSREILFLPPDLVVVYDNLTVANPAANQVTNRWHFMGEPVLAEQKATVVNGAGKLFMTVVSPSVSLTKAVSTGGRAGVYRVDADVVGDPQSNQIVTVFEAANQGREAFCEIESFLSRNQAMKGLYLRTSIAPWVVLFSAKQNGGAVVDDISYTIETDQYNRPRHILLGLPPNTSYNLSVTDNRDFSLTVEGTGHYVSSAQGVLIIRPPVFKEDGLH